MATIITPEILNNFILPNVDKYVVSGAEIALGKIIHSEPNF